MVRDEKNAQPRDAIAGMAALPRDEEQDAEEALA